MAIGGFVLNQDIDQLYPIEYSWSMFEIRQTETDAQWFHALRDRQAKARINIRIRRLSMGNPGDVKPVGQSEVISEE